MNQRRDVVLDQAGLRGSDPSADALEQFRQQQYQRNQAGGDDRRTERTKIAVRPERQHQLVNQVPNEIDGGNRKKTLQQKKNAPG